MGGNPENEKHQGVKNILNSDQDQRYVGPDLNPNCFQRLLADHKIAARRNGLISKIIVYSVYVSVKRLITALPRSCLIFQSTMRTQENNDIFRKKLSVLASLQPPRRCHGALMAFYRIPTLFMMEILCALAVLSLRVHDAHSACAALSQCCHFADAVLKMQ